MFFGKISSLSQNEVRSRFSLFPLMVLRAGWGLLPQVMGGGTKDQYVCAHIAQSLDSAGWEAFLKIPDGLVSSPHLSSDQLH